MVASVAHFFLQRVHLKFSACTTLYSYRDSVPIPVFPVEDISTVMVNISKMRHKTYELPQILILIGIIGFTLKINNIQTFSF